MYGLDIVVHANKTCYHMPVVSQTAQVGLFAIFHYVDYLQMNYAFLNNSILSGLA